MSEPAQVMPPAQAMPTRAVPPVQVTDEYDYRSTAYLEELLRGRDANDPLVLQFRPDARELDSLAYELRDPIGDAPFTPVKGIVHRYPDRVLLKVAHSCPVYCRFCFRRDMIGAKGEPLQGAELAGALDYVRAHPDIWEVILTGGDPLSLSARRLGEVMRKLAEIEHLSVLRIHSRVPVVAPASVDDDVVNALTQGRRAVGTGAAGAGAASTRPGAGAGGPAVYLAVHVNHVDELTDAAVAALGRLVDGGVALLSQTVLLRGVNDDAAVLEALFRRLVGLRVRPYYLHHPDLAPGTSHFRVSIEVGQALMRRLQGRVSGLCLPTYVLDIPGGFGKIPIGPGYVGDRIGEAGRWVVDPQGQRHSYPE